MSQPLEKIRLARIFILFCFQLLNHAINDLLSFIRLVVNIRIHICQEFLKDLQDKWLCDCEAHMVS